MWYFAWILGLLLAAAFAVLNAMGFKWMDDESTRKHVLQENTRQLQRLNDKPATCEGCGFYCVCRRARMALLWQRFVPLDVKGTP